MAIMHRCLNTVAMIATCKEYQLRFQSRGNQYIERRRSFAGVCSIVVTSCENYNSDSENCLGEVAKFYDLEGIVSEVELSQICRSKKGQIVKILQIGNDIFHAEAFYANI